MLKIEVLNVVRLFLEEPTVEKFTNKLDSPIAVCYIICYNVMGGGVYMTIDEILKSIRKEMNISQEILARELDVSYATLNRWENKKAKPSRLAMRRLKEYCKSNPIPENIKQSLNCFK